MSKELRIGAPGAGPGSGVPAFSVSRDSAGILMGVRDPAAPQFAVSRDSRGLLLSAWPVPLLVSPVSLGPWTVYQFLTSGTFELAGHVRIRGDVFLEGGGGAGGGGYQGGGGGAGGFLDEHDVDITSGDVVVGAGGAEVAYRALQGNQGGDSSFAGLVAYGGGYGSSQWGARGGYGLEDEIYYQASDGASGGGGGPWPAGGEYADKVLPEGYGWGGTTDVAPWDRYQDVAIWQGHSDGGLAVHGHQGHWGHAGNGYTAWYQRTAGGGGGAWWPAYGGEMPNGGLGRPCDIAGWYQHPDPIMNGLYRDAGWRYVPWFAGGGGGKERDNNWSYMSGHGGYGGGGDFHAAGIDGTGGGGSGAGWNAAGLPIGQAPGPKGGDGTVIIRIPTSAESLVEYPVPLGHEDVWDAYEEEWVSTAIYPEGISVVHLPPEQTHTDCMGEEPMVYWGWPDDHGSDFPPQL